MSLNYDVNTANTNRMVRYFIQPTHATDIVANVFLILKGPAMQHPHYGKITTAPTANQTLAQLRVSLVARAITAYAPLVGVKLTLNTDGEANGAMIVEFETDESGVFFNNLWTTDQTLVKNLVTDISDTVGVADRPVKTKSGLQTLIDALATVSYDGGTTGPFGLKSASGSIVLPDGTTTSGAPILSTPGTGSGLTITLRP